jgi:UDP-glucuronate 4-epimerase
MARIFITGIAGFIGFHLAQKLHKAGHYVSGMDNFNEYYDVDLKDDRCEILNKIGIVVYDRDLLNKSDTFYTLKFEKPDLVIHLAAYAGVRHSYDHAMDYIQNNIVGTQNLIEALEELNINKAIYASTSCVMAGNPLPWKEDEPTGHQLNPYGYTKRTNECQFKTSKIKQNVGLRFFTVYGPYGRPDMALFQFAEAAVSGKTIDVYNFGDMKRDFTYVDDIVNGIKILMNHILNTEEPQAEIYNIGRGQQVQLMDFIAEIEKNMGRELNKNMVPRHPADTLETWSDTTKLQALGWKPKVSIPEGVAKFCEWYKNYYGVN